MLFRTVTAATAWRTLALYLALAAVGKVLRYGISGEGPSYRPPEEKEIKRNDLIDRAVYAKDEHAIKFTEACLREYQLNPKQVYLQAAWGAVERLRL